MNIRLISALVSATAAFSAPVFAQNASVYGPETYGNIHNRPPHGMSTSREIYNRTQDEPEFYNNGWVQEDVFHHSRPGAVDPDAKAVKLVGSRHLQ